MVQHKFTMDLTWADGRNGTGNITSSNLQTQISIPQEMNGPGIGTNPDEMLLGAAATCYLITLAALLERSEIDVMSLSMQAHGFVSVENGVFTYEKIVHKPTIVVQELSEHLAKRIERLAHKAEQTCMISKAVKGNVLIECDVQILEASI
ncbi:SACOL1771 family peroxiredoxin [Lysinibacillus irui]|uniref:SACOL1771 family peroxiredoxin n=1 Tax=Lysinibacillus irui TaxID=2998077 RepID=A0AAJ5RIG7_9BACI|nr:MULTISPECIES: SACOL1771 family peroxiredoxin [Lysinibacillus]MEA0553521.1 SACOL1771 family peroxiredoxin [Lysinibacillus irui]MEA0564514.1 SACOL1771 family peroxiredoxin [Lysinibacillus irui]MEA0975905.1 SACOL1771 family peroxiredoxin [Lysinibacillus irui]MEA1042059.1 SACOL1771 family peroxiredoxin [Lysinibacillus irui]WDV06106.1 SACOL1771 family peroxiredoxin [Lysinibacillus irui]